METHSISWSSVENCTIFFFSYTVANFLETSLTLKVPSESSSNKCSREPTYIGALNTEGKLSKILYTLKQY